MDEEDDVEGQDGRGIVEDDIPIGGIETLYSGEELPDSDNAT